MVHMGEGEELWNKYCSFFDKPFSEQVEHNEALLKEHFEKWKQTKTAKQLCPKGVKKLEDVPVTTYNDYPILQEFGAKVQQLSETIPQMKGELLWDYYVRISGQAAKILDGWLPDEYSFCLKTSGASGESKWFAYDKTYWERAVRTGFQIAILACSDEWGTTKIRRGDKFLNLAAPPPYGSSVGTRTFETFLKASPPTHVVEKITDMRKKMSLVYKTIERGEKIDFAFGPASVLSMVSKYFTEPDKLYKDRYQSMRPGMVKLILFLKYLQAKMSGKKNKTVSEVVPAKGLVCTAWDGTIYREYLRDQFNIEPFNMYAASDTHIPFMGRPHRKWDFFPNLETVYLEFLADDNEINKINELKKNQTYELVVTTFGSMTVRLRIGDLFRVTDFEDDGTPILRFESRTADMIDIYGYFRLSETMMREALNNVGLTATDDWAVTQELLPKERVCILMEKRWDYPENQAARLIFESLRKINPEFESYIKDYKIKDPLEVLEVKYLRKGAFMRYTMKKAKEGVPFGQIKPPKIIGPEKRELVNLLESV